MSIARPREDRLALAVLIMMGAFFCFTLIDSAAKWLVLAGLPALQVAFIRYAGHFVASLIFIAPREGWSAFHSNAPLIQTLRALALVVGTIFNFFALTYLPLTITTAIFFAAPLLVCLMSIPVLGETVGLRRLIAVLVGFMGVLIITQPWSVDFHPAMFFSLGALCAASTYFVLTRKVAGIDNNPTGQIYTSGIPTLGLLPFVISGWVWPEGLIGWSLTIAIGFTAALGHSMLTVAHLYGEASKLAPVVYVQILYATAISWLIFAQPPDRWTILGTIVIVASGLYIWMRERKRT